MAKDSRKKQKQRKVKCLAGHELYRILSVDGSGKRSFVWACDCNLVRLK